MFIDASIIVAILLQEIGFEAYVRILDDANTQLYCSPLAKYEATLSIARACSGTTEPPPTKVEGFSGFERLRRKVLFFFRLKSEVLNQFVENKPTADEVGKSQEAVNRFLSEISTRDVMITDSIGQSAIEAAKIYGKAVGHKADLNFGDCFSYACAKAYRCRLLYKGNDFSRTDLA